MRTGAVRSAVAVVSALFALLLLFDYLGAASNLQEDLQTPALYLAQHARQGDAIALPDHAITSVVEYYLGNDRHRVPLWPQTGVRQRYVEGFDLESNPWSGFPPRVWLVSDGSVSGVGKFQRMLEQKGYMLMSYKYFKGFNGSVLALYQSTKLPMTAVIAPSGGSTLRGSTILDAFAFVQHRDTSVVMKFVLTGGSLFHTVLGVASSSGYGFVLRWNSTSVPNGTYALQSRVTDAAGNTNLSPPVTVAVENY
jgi:hypothetical protein